MGRPAEAMAQFDQAVSIDKENAHAYNLISEVLLQRGLYRSALPIIARRWRCSPMMRACAAGWSRREPRSRVGPLRPSET